MNKYTSPEKFGLPEADAQEAKARDKNYGFVIDTRSCIGCHACSTACKSENEVPLGVYRTWVKYTEVGTFPTSHRQFQVTRCNHCANPPCVRICPVSAMYQREDGIVEFDSDACIGCKACMQACPYDAIHIDPETHTAAKCHYCAHRVDVGLEPSCVVVCPTHAIIAGDMNDPNSEISKVLNKEQVTVRKPEQGTAPNLYYVGGSDVGMHPTAAESPNTFLWADVIKRSSYTEAYGTATPPPQKDSLHPHTRLKQGQPQGLPNAGPIQLASRGTAAEQMVQVAYNAQHKLPWHWPVPAYLVTKGIASGMFLLMAIAWIMGVYTVELGLVGGFTSLAFLGLTTLLLVIDLDRPERFLYILLRPQWRSWLTRGAVLLIGSSTITGLWWCVEAAAYMKWLDPSLANLTRPVFMYLGIPFAIGAAIYTAYLFGQAEGRDLWQSPMLPMHLLVQAMMVGAASFAIMLPLMKLPYAFKQLVLITFAVSLLLDLFITFLGEFGMPHASEVAAKAAHEISHGKYFMHFWYGCVVLGHIIPLALLWSGMASFAVVAGLCTVVGLYLFEYAYVMAPQEVPNS